MAKTLRRVSSPELAGLAAPLVKRSQDMKRPAISVPILRPIFGVLRAYWRSDRVMLLLVAGAVLGSSLVAIAGPSG